MPIFTMASTITLRNFIRFLPISFRLILTSVLLTSKFNNDIFYGNQFVAYVGGVQLQEINGLEV
jgi:hypothetical protein